MTKTGLEQGHNRNHAGFWALPLLALLALVVVVIGFLHPGDWPWGGLSGLWSPEVLSFFWLGAMVVAAFQLRWSGALLTLAGGAVLAGLFEAAQVWTPFRDAAWADLGWNLVGLSLGVLLGLVVGSFLSRSLPSPEP